VAPSTSVLVLLTWKGSVTPVGGVTVTEFEIGPVVPAATVPVRFKVTHPRRCSARTLCSCPRTIASVYRRSISCAPGSGERTQMCGSPRALAPWRSTCVAFPLCCRDSILAYPDAPHGRRLHVKRAFRRRAEPGVHHRHSGLQRTAEPLVGAAAVIALTRRTREHSKVQ